MQKIEAPTAKKVVTRASASRPHKMEKLVPWKRKHLAKFTRLGVVNRQRNVHWPTLEGESRVLGGKKKLGAPLQRPPVFPRRNMRKSLGVEDQGLRVLKTTSSRTKRKKGLAFESLNAEQKRCSKKKNQTRIIANYLTGVIRQVQEKAVF